VKLYNKPELYCVDRIGSSDFIENNSIFNDSIIFDTESYTPYATVHDRLAQSFFKAQILSKYHPDYKNYFLLNIFVPTCSLQKHKIEDPETPIERIRLWYLNMIPPKIPLLVKIYLYEDDGELNNFGPQTKFNYLWPLKNPNPKTQNFITLNEYDNNIKSFTRNPDGFMIMDLIHKFAKEKNIEIKIVNYATPFEEAINYLTSSRGNFTRFGAIHHLSQSLSEKTFIFGFGSPEHRIPIIQEITNEVIIPSTWANKTVTQIDRDSYKVYSGPVYGFQHISNYEDVKNVFETQLKNVTN
jgi:hypothetical protein